jgi:hypothetical protein
MPAYYCKVPVPVGGAGTIKKGGLLAALGVATDRKSLRTGLLVGFEDHGGEGEGEGDGRNDAKQ